MQARADLCKATGKSILCALMIDEIAIRKHVEWTGTKFTGYVDMGTGVDDDSAPVATEALVFMAVSLNDGWKIPCGYFLIAGLSGTERANLVRQCIQKLYDIGVNVVSLTCDAPSCHFTMMDDLGVQLDATDIQAHFCHPSDSNLKVHVIFDVCHMLKLVRNAFAEGGIFLDPSGQKVKWSYLHELHKLQDTEGFHLANKFRLAHVNWRTQKMKVNLAAQTISESVATAIEFCDHKLKLDQFAGSEATVKFLRLFDHLFDVLNSRNPLARGYKAPLKPTNEKLWKPFLHEAYQYIVQLKDAAGQCMIRGRRKTAFIGFLCAIKSTEAIFNTYVKADTTLKYLLTYKLSQDHLELFFAAVRSSFGSNNNPTARQYSAA